MGMLLVVHSHEEVTCTTCYTIILNYHRITTVILLLKQIVNEALFLSSVSF